MFDPNSVDNLKKKSSNKVYSNKITKWLEKRLTSEIYGSDQFQIMVTEVECNDPDCVPLETMIIVINNNPDTNFSDTADRWVDKITKPVVEVTEEDVQDLELPNRWLTVKDGSAKELNFIIDSFISRNDHIEGLTTLSLLFEDKIKEINSKLNALSEIKQPSIPKSNITYVQMESTNVTNKPEKLSNSVTSNQPYIQEQNVENSESTGNPTNKPEISAVKMAKIDTETQLAAAIKVPVTKKSSSGLAPRHNKEKRRRGCPCCDPDNLENILDKMMFMENPAM